MAGARAEALADAINNPEASRLNAEVAELSSEVQRLRQRIADLSQAQQDLAVAEAKLKEKRVEAATYLDSLYSALMIQ